MVKRNKKLVKNLNKTEVKLETAKGACKKMEGKYAALSEGTKRIVSSFKNLEKAAKRIRSGYFKLKRILEQDSGLYRRQNHTAMKVLMEALEAYDNLRSYSIDKELREVDDMLIQTSAPIRNWTLRIQLKIHKAEVSDLNDHVIKANKKKQANIETESC